MTIKLFIIVNFQFVSMMKFLEFIDENHRENCLRVIVSKNLLTWNMGGSQIVPRLFFSYSPHKVIPLSKIYSPLGIHLVNIFDF